MAKLRDQEGQRDLTMTSSDAGAVVRFLDIYNRLSGGLANLKLTEAREGAWTGGLDLRISTIDCTVSAPAIINFGQVGKNLIAHSELSRKSMQAGVSCNQEADGAISVDV